MIELDILQQHNSRQVMQELWPLIEECGVVLVTFDDEIRSIRDLKAFSEILRNAANEKRWFSARNFQDPGQHRCGCRLAVRTRNDDRVLTANEEFFHGLGHRRITNSGIEYVLDLDVASR